MEIRLEMLGKILLAGKYFFLSLDPLKFDDKKFRLAGEGIPNDNWIFSACWVDWAISTLVSMLLFAIGRVWLSQPLFFTDPSI